MRRLAIVGIAAGLLLVSTRALIAQEPGEPTQQRAGLLARQDSVRLVVIGGRIQAIIFGDGQASEEYGARRENLLITVSETGPLISYEAIAPEQRLLFDCRPNGELTIRQQLTANEPNDKGAPTLSTAGQAHVIEYIQTARTVELKIGDGQKATQIQGRSLWHLLIIEPALCEQHLIPVLEKLRPHWRLTETAEAARGALVQFAQSDHAVNHRRWAELVAKLGDDHFTVRQHADRQLRAAGETALAYLETLQRADLDAEQWRRLEDIIDDAYDNDREDVAERIAARLTGDRTIWIELLEDDRQWAREAALQQLNSLSTAPVDFDPAASTDERARQIERIKLLARSGDS